MSETKTTNPLPYGGTTFTYDGFGNRVTKGSTFYFGDTYEIRGSTTIVHLFANGQRVTSIRGDGNTQYYHPNHLGSASVATDQAGKVEERIEYYPYGTYRSRTTGMSTSGFPKVNYTFTDQEDDETGFYNYKARLYDPLIGRFISADSLVPEPGDLQALNKYGYARNNPLIYVDPSGHDWNLIAAYNSFKSSVAVAYDNVSNYAQVKAATTVDYASAAWSSARAVASNFLNQTKTVLDNASIAAYRTSVVNAYTQADVADTLTGKIWLGVTASGGAGVSFFGLVNGSYSYLTNLRGDTCYVKSPLEYNAQAMEFGVEVSANLAPIVGAGKDCSSFGGRNETVAVGADVPVKAASASLTKNSKSVTISATMWPLNQGIGTPVTGNYAQGNAETRGSAVEPTPLEIFLDMLGKAFMEVTSDNSDSSGDADVGAYSDSVGGE